MGERGYHSVWRFVIINVTLNNPLDSIITDIDY